MYINKLEITGFGRIKNKTIELSKGFNIIYGRNESGKTTIWWFIRGMLYGLKGGRQTKDGVPPPLKRFKPWNGGNYRGLMEYTLDSGEQYRVERDFNTGCARVFDSHFNDISGLFNVTREDGIQFAEKQMGLNDTCFEKTSLIKQMNSRIDENGSRELVSRLVNVSQTGFEDVSFKKAQQVLKDTLKVYVGTDKTTERPLDKIVRKITELEEHRKSLTKMRESALSTQCALNSSIAEKARVEKRKEALEEAGKDIGLIREVEEYKDKLARLNEIAGKISSVEKELTQAQQQYKEVSETCEQLAAFSSCSDEYIENLNFKYHKLRMLLDENTRLEGSIEAKKKQCIRMEAEIEPFRKLAMLGEDSDRKVIAVKKELDSLKYEYGKSTGEAYGRKMEDIGYGSRIERRGYGRKADVRGFGKNIDASEYDSKIDVRGYGNGMKDGGEKRRNAVTVFLILTALSAACIIFGINGGKGIFTNVPPVVMYIAALLLFALAAVQMYIGFKPGRGFLGGKGVNEEELSKISDLANKISQREKLLNEMLGKAGVETVEDFIAAKAACDSLIQRLNISNNELGDMEENLEANLETVFSLKSEVIRNFVSAGIMDNDKEDIEDRHAAEFKAAAAKYKEAETAYGYLSKRVEDLKNSLDPLYKICTSICMYNCTSVEGLYAFIKKISEKARENDEKVYAAAKEALHKFEGIELEKPYFDVIIESGAGQIRDNPEKSLDKLERDWKLEYENACAVENELLLRIKEYETMLKGIPDDEEMQRVHEQLEELKVNRDELEEKGEALKIAIDVMAEASIELQRSYVPLLNSRMSDIISNITAGRYKEVRADDNLTLKTISPDTLGIANAGVLSCGTAEQMYFALRVAMSEIITNGEKLPLIMDETFAYYDDSRSKESFKILDKLSSSRQIILFTCKEREIEMAKEQIPTGRCHIL